MIRLLFVFFKSLKKRHGDELFRLPILCLAITAFSSSGFLYFELSGKPDLTWTDAIWWSVVTMTTVGYGDLFPETLGGRYLIGFPTMLFGISILGYLLSVVATDLIEARAKELRGMGEAIANDHILLVHNPGINRLSAVVAELRNDPKSAKRAIVLIDEQLEELPPQLHDQAVRFIRGDPTKAETLERANFRGATNAIVLALDPLDAHSDHQSLAVALTLEKLHSEIITTCEVVDPERVELFKRAGVDGIVCLADLGSNIIVQEALDPGVHGVLHEITSNTFGQQVYLVAVGRLSDPTFGGITTSCAKAAVLCIGLQRGEEVLINPGDAAAVQPDDRVVCIAARRPDPVSN